MKKKVIVSFSIDPDFLAEVKKTYDHRTFSRTMVDLLKQDLENKRRIAMSDVVKLATGISNKTIDHLIGMYETENEDLQHEFYQIEALVAEEISVPSHLIGLYSRLRDARYERWKNTGVMHEETRGCNSTGD